MDSKLTKFTTNEKILMLALDHRGSFKKLINPDDPDSTDPDEAIELKSEIISSVYDQMSGVLIDPDFGLPAYNKLDTHTKPFLLPIEESGYKDIDGEQLTKLKYTAEQIKEAGASGVKLLLHLNPEMKHLDKQIETAGAVMEMAKEIDFPYFLEPRSYGKKLEEVDVVKIVEILLDAKVQPDVFKLEYPGSKEKCEKITQLVGDTPWILLTRGQEFLDFYDNLDVAIKAGASGFLAGRSLWQEFASVKDESREEFFNTTLKERFKNIADIAVTS
jgi:tagatose 1,6-diphosphate aldolase